MQIMNDISILIISIFGVVLLVSAILMIKNYIKNSGFEKTQEEKKVDETLPPTEKIYKSNAELFMDKLADLVPEEERIKLDNERKEYQNKKRQITNKGEVDGLIDSISD